MDKTRGPAGTRIQAEVRKEVVVEINLRLTYPRLAWGIIEGRDGAAPSRPCVGEGSFRSTHRSFAQTTICRASILQIRSRISHAAVNSHHQEPGMKLWGYNTKLQFKVQHEERVMGDDLNIVVEKWTIFSRGPRPPTCAKNYTSAKGRWRAARKGVFWPPGLLHWY